MLIKHNSPLIKQNYIKALIKPLKSNQICSGETVLKLERYIEKKYYKGGFACAVSSGTSALFLAIKSLTRKKNPRILAPTYACSAVLNAINLANGIPVIGDINKDDLSLNTNKKYSKIDIVIALNIYGSEPNLKKIKKKYPNAKIILDACHSIGKIITKKSIAYKSDIVIHSFYATKIITSGHGGLIWSKKKKLILFCKDFINFDQRKEYKERFNFLLNDFQAALVLEQLKNIKSIRNKRLEFFLTYKKHLSKKVNIFSKYDLKKDIIYRAIIFFNNKRQRDKFKNKLIKNKIQSIVPILNYELLHNYLKLDKKKYKNSEDVCSRTLSIPMHLALSNKDIKKICYFLKNI